MIRLISRFLGTLNSEDLRSQVAHTTTARLSSDLGRACRMKADADIYLVARNRFRFAAHKAILSCRCRVLGRLIDKAVAERRALISVGESFSCPLGSSLGGMVGL